MSGWRKLAAALVLETNFFGSGGSSPSPDTKFSAGVASRAVTQGLVPHKFVMKFAGACAATMRNVGRKTDSPTDLFSKNFDPVVQRTGRFTSKEAMRVEFPPGSPSFRGRVVQMYTTERYERSNSG